MILPTTRLFVVADKTAKARLSDENMSRFRPIMESDKNFLTINIVRVVSDIVRLALEIQYYRIYKGRNSGMGASVVRQRSHTVQTESPQHLIR